MGSEGRADRSCRPATPSLGYEFLPTLMKRGANREGARVPQGVRDSFWTQGMQAVHKSALDCITTLKVYRVCPMACAPSTRT